MLIELDDLANTIETYGPRVADAVLVAVAERLRRTVRPADLVARLGGGRFAVLFENVARAQVDDIAKRVAQTVNGSLSVLGHAVPVRASLGLVQADGITDAGVLMERAGAALARAKATTTERLAWFAEPTVQ